ncbi:SDR family NAD(P)-dependent oxidoreductase [Conexibacter woesei]|uniref:Short-chain dehydrogenase/reductase SDR n=1 Tax=Conexibacter woesei (strain DSM 14684 / CCUG 47730 / CIP 108061 / JCM 11494 / NBRC 100937 / ID131577) TaxID=469383 RepID=D3F4B3_CONWI|nr:glucose 1-dehydrogenase [Conexibacter woesei]ADB50485.1 short-chain dehydrogenase/reductase SDR [Conexibacter woesei DSM 14684]
MGLSGLNGRRALVTGAGRGIGAAIARRLAQEGVAVAVNDVEPERVETMVQELTAAGHAAVAAVADVSRPDAAETLVADVTAALGGLEILVNNAGTGMRGSIAEHTPEEWRRVLGVNLDGPFWLSRAALPVLAGTPGAAIVNIASVAVIGFFGQVAYDASKGGLLTLTRSLAVECGRKGIRANTVCPGFIETELVTEELKRIGEKTVAALPLGRWGTAEDIAGTVAWLTCDDAAYVTGQSLMVDGGWVRGV